VIHTAEVLVPDPCLFEVEIAIATLKRYKYQVVIKFRQNRFKQVVKQCGLRFMNSLILFGIRKNCLSSGRSLLLFQFARRAIKFMVLIIIKEYQCYQLYTTFFSNILLRLSPCVDKIVADNRCGDLMYQINY
jgi:hypothetical protein